jgi:small-conductance mechanosensitive channel
MLNDPIIKHLTIALIILAAAIVVGQFLRRFLTSLLGKVLKATRTSLDDRIVEVFRVRIRGIVIIIGGFQAVREVRNALTAEHNTLLLLLSYIDIVLYFFLVLILFRLAGKTITAVLEWYMDEVSSKTNSNITPTVIPMVSKIVNIVLVLIATMVVLDHFSVNIGGLVVSLGVGSLAVALAAQETVANMISGFVILIDQPFRVGDRIRLPSGEEGDVTAIGLRSTRILNYENNLLVVPNTDLVKNKVINFSFPNHSMRVMVDVNVAYGADIEKARQIILALAGQHPDIARDPSPEVLLSQFGETSLQIKLIARATEFIQRANVEAVLREQIYNAFVAAGIEIPFMQRMVQITHTDEAKAS